MATAFKPSILGIFPRRTTNRSASLSFAGALPSCTCRASFGTSGASKTQKAARLLTWDLQAASKVELFTYLSPKWITDPRDQTELKAIAREAHNLRAKRNRLAHGLWGYKPGERKKHRLLHINRKTRVLPKSELVSVAEVRQWASQLDALNVRLKKFHRHLGAPVP